MDQEIKADWVAALRSGDYKQGKTNLRSCDECFCCLGVLCDLAAKAGLSKWEYAVTAFQIFGASTLLPEEVSVWAGFPELHLFGMKVGIKGAHLDLASHNDEGKTFAEIADAIEAQL